MFIPYYNIYSIGYYIRFNDILVRLVWDVTDPATNSTAKPMIESEILVVASSLIQNTDIQLSVPLVIGLLANPSHTVASLPTPATISSTP